jgi:PAS domain S-box-containing protein
MTTLIKREKVSKYLGQILDTSPEGISITDFEGTILYLNNKYEQLTSLKREDLLGKSVQNVCKRGDFDFVVNPEVVKSIQESHCSWMVIRFLTNRGKWSWS